MARYDDNELIEIAGEVVARAKSGLAVLWDDGTRREWLPLSQCELAEDERSILVPEWLAKKRGLI